MYAEFDVTIDPASGTNVLADLGTGGPGILGRDMPTVAAGPTMLDGDVATAAPVARDRSFWYLVFAGYLDARTAYDASSAVVESAITAANAWQHPVCLGHVLGHRRRSDCHAARRTHRMVRQCAGRRWPVRSRCFPTAPCNWCRATPAPTSMRPLGPCSRELLSWRMAELATMEAAIYGGRARPSSSTSWTFVEASPMALDLMSLPPTTSPADMAVAARAGFDALLSALGLTPAA